MTSSFDEKSANNRYGFHTSNPASTVPLREKAGVSIEYAHNRVVDPLGKLIRLLDQAGKIARATNANTEANNFAVTLLTVCKNKVSDTLHSGSQHLADETHQETPRSFSR